MTDPWARPTGDEPAPSDQPAEAAADPATTAFAADAPAADAPEQPAAHAMPQEVPASNPPAAKRRFSIKGLLRDPLSIVLVVVIVLALTAAGLIGGEVYARHVGATVVSQATACVIQDKVDVSFGKAPFLLQVAQKKYDNITVTSAGDNVGIAKGMKAQIVMNDVELKPTSNSTGTMGALTATLDWPTDGIKETIANAIPLIGSFVNSVSTDAAAGTIELEAGLANFTVKPTVNNGAVTLQVVELGGLGFLLPRETIQPALDAFAQQITRNYPMGIRADSIQVTDKGIRAKFSTTNATMPPASENRCFTGLPTN